MSKITIAVSGETGSGKSAIVGEIEIALKAIGVPVTVAERDTMVVADYQHWIDLYKPEITIVEQNIPVAAHPTEGGKYREGLSHDDLCTLSRIYNDREAPVPHGTNFRVNEWLKAQIAAATHHTDLFERPSYYDQVALDATRQIEAMPSGLHPSQRTARIQLIVLKAMCQRGKCVYVGSRRWDHLS
jgi:hypothetical protein